MVQSYTDHGEDEYNQSYTDHGEDEYNQSEENKNLNQSLF